MSRKLLLALTVSAVLVAPSTASALVGTSTQSVNATTGDALALGVVTDASFGAIDPDDESATSVGGTVEVVTLDNWVLQVSSDDVGLETTTECDVAGDDTDTPIPAGTSITDPLKISTANGLLNGVVLGEVLGNGKTITSTPVSHAKGTGPAVGIPLNYSYSTLNQDKMRPGCEYGANIDLTLTGSSVLSDLTGLLAL